MAEIRVRATCQRTARLLAWAEPLGERTWAVESAGDFGYLLSHQLVTCFTTLPRHDNIKGEVSSAEFESGVLSL